MEEDKEIKKFIRSVKLTNLVTLMSQYAKFSTSVLIQQTMAYNKFSQCVNIRDLFIFPQEFSDKINQ